MKRKVAIVIPSLMGGGAEKVMINIISNLDKNKFDTRLIVVNKKGPYISLIPDDIHVVDLKADRVRYSIKNLIKELNLFKPDIVLSTLGYLNLILISIKPFLKSKPKIIVREANTPSKDINQLSKYKKFIFNFLYKRLYKKADYIIAQCEGMKKDIIHCFKIEDKDKVICIYNPLDINLINNLKIEKNPYFKGNINLLSVGRLSYQKGFDILIDAFKIVNQKIPNTYLTILGEGELEEKLKEKSKELNIDKKISFVKFQQNPYPFYYYSDMYILSSRWEGFPNTLLEAIACQTKVVATNCKSGPVEILENDKYGVIVEEENSLALAEGIISYINQESKTNNRAEYFNINKIIKDYERILLA